MKTIVLLVAAMFLTGCLGRHGLIKSPPAVSSHGVAGEIFIVRNGNLFAGAQNYVVTFDSEEILGIGINEYTKFKVDQGDHSIGVSCVGGWAPGTHVNEKPATIEAGKAYYFMARAGGVCAVIEPLTEEVGRAWVAKSKFIPTKSPSID